MTVQRAGQKLYNWASILDPDTFEQAKRTSEMPFVHPHMALMPDAHFGMGATVGSVIPTKSAIIPAAVGVDIGCGMIAVRTQLYAGHIQGLDRSRVRKHVEQLIPLSAGGYNQTVQPDAEAYLHELDDLAYAAGFTPEAFAGNWRLQLGSLGSGNHFIEICLDEEDRVWLFLHSGSRGVGNKIAQRHIKQAQKLAEQWWIPLPDKDLAYLVEGTDEFWAYIRELRWAQHFAKLNREVMMSRLQLAVSQWAGFQVEPQETINCHHNYTEQERHYGEQVWLSRKGAIHAGKGVMGLIPGSMGAASYVVEGKGNRLALNSAPHGAGRLLARRKAKAAFSLESLKEVMGDREWRVSDAFLDEHPAAYKPVEQVMADADDLVEIKYELRSIVNIKGE